MYGSPLLLFTDRGIILIRLTVKVGCKYLLGLRGMPGSVVKYSRQRAVDMGEE